MMITFSFQSIKTGDVINELYDDPAISDEVQVEVTILFNIEKSRNL